MRWSVQAALRLAGVTIIAALYAGPFAAASPDSTISVSGIQPSVDPRYAQYEMLLRTPLTPADRASFDSMLLELVQQEVFANTALACGAALESPRNRFGPQPREQRPETVMRALYDQLEIAPARKALRPLRMHFPLNLRPKERCSFTVVGFLIDETGAVIEPRVVAFTGSSAMAQHVVSAVSSVTYEPRLGAKPEWSTLSASLIHE